MKRALRVVAALVVVWFIFLLIAGVIYGSRAGERVAMRVGDSLQATAKVDSSRLALIRGHIEINGVHARREDLGVLALDVGRIRCDVLPLGAVLFERTCRVLTVEDMRLEVSSAALLRISRPKKKPMTVGAVHIRNASFLLEASALLPDLGKIEIKIDELEAGTTTFTTPVSWMFTMTALRATLDLPAGVMVTLVYRDGMITATGSIFGSASVTVPLRLPKQSDLVDAKAELGALADVGKQLAEELIERRAKDWLRSKIPTL